MTLADDFSLRPHECSGVVRIFPLPNLVLFPRVMQPLRIFESRYRALVEDALRTDRLIAMALLKPGWESTYEAQPPIESVLCLGRVVTHRRLPDGRYNILLLGLQRAEICQELPRTRPFRQARVRLLQDRRSAGRTRPDLQRQLLALFQRLAPVEAGLDEELKSLRDRRLSLAALTDIIAFTMDFDLAAKQALLSQCDVDRRAEWLLRHLQALEETSLVAAAGGAEFPPTFSWN
jgi:ATP-dependent Lon protease